MAKLYDVLKRNDKIVGDYAVVLIDNVADYFSDNDGVGLLPRHFPCIRPPFDKVYFEYNTPKVWRKDNPVKKYGVFVDADQQQDDVINITMRIAVLFVDKKTYYHNTTYSILCNRLGEMDPYITPEGKNGYMIHGYDRGFGGQEIADLGYYLYPALLAISLMHCKNTTVTSVDPPEKLSRKHKKKHSKPLSRYHVLNIEPMKKILRKEGNIEKTGIRQALHICRGHFKDYRDGGGLFGKYKDIYWWESHVRGDINEGSVTKDYNIAL